MSRIGRIPAVGDELEIANGILRVERMDGRRVDRVRFTPTPEEVPND
jgi:CBS domain containing-hemolysin-like protein